MSERRLRELVTTLARTRPVLDDVARARVAAAVLAGVRAPQVARPSHRRRWVIAIAAGVAVLAIGVALRMFGAPPPTVAAPGLAGVALSDGAVMLGVPGGTVRGEVEGAALTLYGAGWVKRHGRRIIADAEGLVVDRATGGAPVELAVRGATIRVQHATFSVNGSSPVRVTVIRGEIVLRCVAPDRDQPVTAGGSATCDAESPAPPRPAPAQLPPGTGAGSAMPVPDPTAGGEVAGYGGPVVVEAAPRPPVTRREAPVPAPGRPALAARSPGPPAAPAAVDAPHAPAVGPAADRATAPAAPRTPAVDLAPATATAPAADASPARAPATRSPPAPRYAAAERLMASDPIAARAALRALISDAPAAPEAAPALLDLARLAAAAGDDVAAHAALDELAARSDAAVLAMPAAYLRCVLARTEPARRTCLAGFRAAFPDSPRDAEILAHLAIASARAGDCRAALPLLLEYTRRYPDRPKARVVRDWRARCERAAAPP